MVQAAAGGGLPRAYFLLAFLLAGAGLAVSLGCAGRGASDWDAGVDSGPDLGVDVSTLPFQCRNGNKDVGETDLNCGGPCPPCALDQGCAQDVDCAKGRCVLDTAKCTAAATCSNGRRDVSETDTDCGGPDCAPCAANRMCSANDDCQSLVCSNGRCN
jgi:hypothetical protein